MSIEKLWTYIRGEESKAIDCWLTELESTAENILKHYEMNTTTPWVFNLQSFKLKLGYHYVHIVKTYLKKDRRLKYLIKQPGNQEIFCPANYCVNSVEFGTSPIASENKIEVSDGNVAYIKYVFHLSNWLTQFEVNRLKQFRNRKLFEVYEMFCLIQKPSFKTEFDLQPYTIDKVFYDVVGFMSSIGKLTVEILEPRNERLSTRYQTHLRATKPLSLIYEVPGKMIVEDDEVARSWRRYITPHLLCIYRPHKSSSDSYGENVRKRYHCVVEGVEKKKLAVKIISNDGNSQPNKKQCVERNECVKVEKDELPLFGCTYNSTNVVITQCF